MTLVVLTAPSTTRLKVFFKVSQETWGVPTLTPPTKEEQVGPSSTSLWLLLLSPPFQFHLLSPEVVPNLSYRKATNKEIWSCFCISPYKLWISQALLWVFGSFFIGSYFLFYPKSNWKRQNIDFLFVSFSDKYITSLWNQPKSLIDLIPIHLNKRELPGTALQLSVIVKKLALIWQKLASRSRRG